MNAFNDAAYSMAVVSATVALYCVLVNKGGTRGCSEDADRYTPG
jgi:hypothetical protein